MRASTSFRAGVVLFFASSIASAAAPTSTSTSATTDACISAFDHAQRSRSKGHLRRAREELLACTKQECPSVVRADCADVLRQVDAATPSIVLSAGNADAASGDVANVTVDLNGELFASSLDGRAIPVDPGKLSLVFKHPPWAPVTMEIVIGEGEKNRVVRGVFHPTGSKGAAKPGAQDQSVDPLPDEKRSVVGWAVPGGLAVIGIGALGFATYTRLHLGSEVDDLEASCAPTCSTAEHDRLIDQLVTANIAFGVGIASLVLGAAAWFILAPPTKSSRASLTSPTSVVMRW